MDERKLLERAAKAAGLEEFQYINGQPAYRFRRTGLQDWKVWSPLDDDGDAFRLNNRLGYLIKHFVGRVVVGGFGDGVRVVEAEEKYEDHGMDIDKATRRAITRAAAMYYPSDSVC